MSSGISSNSISNKIAMLKEQLRLCISNHLAMAKSHPYNWIYSISIGIVLLAAGIVIAFTIESKHQYQLEQEALDIADDTSQFFSDQLDRAILPLFSMAQFVTELEIFHNLPQQIGPANNDFSLPFIIPDPSPDDDPNNPIIPTHRNVTGVCDDERLVGRFHQIAATIKENAKMQGILVNLQLAPEGVVCLLHPLNNTEDFPPGIFMDNSGALGHDLLTDPERKFIAEQTLMADHVVIAGPLPLKQCEDCDPTVEKAFIARLTISYSSGGAATSGVNKDHTLTVDGRSYPDKWGFAVALINWNVLIEKSGIFETFQKEQLEFQLTRTDLDYDPILDMYTENVVVLAETVGFQASYLSRRPKVTTSLDTTNNEWEITLVYGSERASPGHIAALVCTIIVSLLGTILSYTILSQRQLHNNLVLEKNRLIIDNARKSAQMERELNDFIAHEVRNPLSAAISACSFVSSAVNETEPLKTQDSILAAQDDMQIIEASLHFVNDLLRNMLDFHRVASNQLHLENTATDIQRDILQPVATMLYRRFETYEVIVDCPDNLCVIVDRLRLKQVVLNLGRNSSKFVEKGFIRLKAEVVEDITNNNNNPVKKEKVVISVEDSGPGIPESKRKNLYSRFQESLDSLNQGTGIGLNLCRKLIDLMGGKIWLDESYHSGLEGCPGARFVIELNNTDTVSLEDIEIGFVSETEQDCDSDSVQSFPAPITNEFSFREKFFLNSMNTGSSKNGFPHKHSLPDELHVLFVDDDLVLRKLFGRSIKRIRPSWVIEEAGNGESALQMAKDKHFDLIFVDQYMTSVDRQMLGTETTMALRSAGVSSIICGLSANQMEENFLKAGADAFMTKPFPCKEEALSKEISRVLQSRRAR